jgi:hypothetical protein
MDLDANAIIASVLIGSVGLGVFIYGKRQSRLPHLIVGGLLLVYPYFVPNLWLMLGIAVVLLLGLFVVARLGL